MRNGKITEEEDRVLRVRHMDSLKIVGIGVPFMPILIKAAARYHIEWMPSAFVNKQEK